MGGQQQYNIQLNQAAIAAGGKTLMELRFTKLDGGTFAQNVVAQVWSPWKYVTSYVPESRVARVCDGKENYRYGFNGMEKDNETKGPGNSLDYGARMFDSRLGRFLSVDAAVAEMPWQAPYQLASNSPIYRLDPDGNWDVTVHAYKDRAKSGYALLVVTDNKGMEVYRTVVKTIGTGGRIRNVKNSDSPQGEYGILGWRKTGSGTNYNRISFGPNNLLALNYKGEEGGSRNGIHVCLHHWFRPA
jgi:RHS repeat-associated protein